MANIDTAATATIGEHCQTGLPSRTGDVPFARLCSACKRVISGEFHRVLKAGYFESEEQPVCPACAGRMNIERQDQRPISAARIIAWGAVAALAAFLVSVILIAAIPASLLFLGIIAGALIGKAIRYASRGRAGRWSQVLAVVLTYFAASASFTPVILLSTARNLTSAQTKRGTQTQVKQQGKSGSAGSPAGNRVLALSGMLAVAVVGFLVVAPFLLLTSQNGALAVVILCFGLVRTWKLTGAPAAITGPFTDTFE
jgi:hypothetical protein